MSYQKYNHSRKKYRKGYPHNSQVFFFVFHPLSSKAEICLNVHPYFYTLRRFRIRKKILFQNRCPSNQTHSPVLQAILVNKTIDKQSELPYLQLHQKHQILPLIHPHQTLQVKELLYIW